MRKTVYDNPSPRVTGHVLVAAVLEAPPPRPTLYPFASVAPQLVMALCLVLSRRIWALRNPT